MSSKKFKVFLLAAAVLALTACGGAGKQEASSTEQNVEMNGTSEGESLSGADGSAAGDAVVSGGNGPAAGDAVLSGADGSAAGDAAVSGDNGSGADEAAAEAGTGVSGSNVSLSDGQTAVQPSGGEHSSQVVEITLDNWNTYFEIVPLHREVIYNSNGTTGTLFYNGFEFALREEYLRNYLDYSGYYFGEEELEKIRSGNGVDAFYDEESVRQLEQQGRVLIPEGAEVSGSFRVAYQGDNLWADHNAEYSESLDYFHGSGGIQLDRDVRITKALYREYLINFIRKGGVYEGSAVSDQPTGSVKEIWNEFFSTHVGTHLLRGHSDDDDSSKTEEFLEGFTVTPTNISGTITIWS